MVPRDLSGVLELARQMRTEHGAPPQVDTDMEFWDSNLQTILHYIQTPDQQFFKWSNRRLGRFFFKIYPTLNRDRMGTTSSKALFFLLSARDGQWRQSGTVKLESQCDPEMHKLQ